MRNLSNSVTPSSVARKSLTIPDKPLIIVSADGRDTLAFSPLLYFINPLCLSALRASLTEGRPTPKNSISSLSEGRYSPSLISSRRIIPSSSSATISESFFVTTGFLLAVSPLTVFFSLLIMRIPADELSQRFQILPYIQEILKQ